MIEFAVVLAVGSPTHRSSLVYNRPRAMLPALGKPLVVRVMDRLYRSNIRKFIVVVGEGEGAVASYLNTSWVPDANIEFVLKFNNKSLLQTLANIARQINAPFLITSYNSFTQAQFYSRILSQHDKYKNELVLSGAEKVLSSSNQPHIALMEEQYVKDIVSEAPENKTGLMLTNLAVCGQNFVDYLAAMPTDKTNLFSDQFMDIAHQYLRTAESSTIIAKAAWTLQIDTDSDLLMLNRQLLDGGQDAYILSELPFSVRITPPVRIDPQVSVGQGAKIGPHVYLERGSSVGYEAVVKEAMVLAGGKVPARETVSNIIISSLGPIN